MNLLYSFRLKDVVILDVLAISLGFVLRAVAGAVAIEVLISDWLLICTILLALFLTLSKRRHELTRLERLAPRATGAILAEYSPYLLDQMISVVTASCVTAYAFYTTAPETRDKFQTDRLAWTIPFVLYGIFRYLYLVHRKEKGGSPTDILLTDRPLLVDVLLWAPDRGRSSSIPPTGLPVPAGTLSAMSFEIKADDVDVDAIMRMIRKRIEEKKQGLYTDEEIREIAEHRLDAVLDAHDFNSDFIADFRARAGALELPVRPGDDLPQQPRGRGPGPGDGAPRCCGRSRSSSGTRTP